MSLINYNGHTFYDNLNKNSLVIDLGGHKGNFSKNILDKYNCNIVIYEPTLEFIDIIKNKLNSEKITLFNKAVSDKNDTILFYNFGGSDLHYGEGNSIIKHKDNYDNSGRFVGAYNIESININDVLNNYDNIDLLKVDVEGAEFLIFNEINNNNLNKISQISLEWHLKNTYKYDEDSVVTKELFEKLHNKILDSGFKCIKTSERPDYLYYK